MNLNDFFSNLRMNMPGAGIILRAAARGATRYLFMPLMIVYMEILLRVLTRNSLTAGMPLSLLLIFTAGMLINLLFALLHRLMPIRIAGIIILFTLGLIYALQYFIYQSFHCYMPLEMIVLEARNVLRNFSDAFKAALVRGIPVILAFAAPLALFIVLSLKRINAFGAATRKWMAGRLRYSLTCALILFATLSGCVMLVLFNDDNRAAVYSEYNFDTSSRRLGILPCVYIDLGNSLFGGSGDNAAVVFADISALPTLPPLPSEGEPAQGGSDGMPDTTHGGDVNPDDIAAQDISLEPATPEPPIEYGYNVLDIDFESLIANERRTGIIKIHEYVASLEPTKQNRHTGIFAGKNLILICAEAFTRQVVDPVMTPTLYRLVHDGFYFSDFYQPGWGAGTAGGEYSIIAGLPPSAGSSTRVLSEQNSSFTIGQMHKNAGYFTASFHNGSHTYYSRNESHPQLGYDPYIAFGSGLHELMGGKFSPSDLELMKATIPVFIDNTPFSVYYMTYSGHSGYSIGNPMARKNWDAFPQQYEQMEDPIRAYMAANLELEYALEYLVGQLEEKGIADDTVIVLASDHYPYGLMRSDTWESDEDYLAMLYGVEALTHIKRDESALIIWSGSLENEHKDLAVEIDTPTSTLDILPTLLNLFGMEFDSRLYIGRDVFSEAMPLVFWPNRSFITQAGVYNSTNNSFTPNGNIALPVDYTATVRAVINNKISFARAVLERDYFNTLFNKDGTLR